MPRTGSRDRRRTEHWRILRVTGTGLTDIRCFENLSAGKRKHGSMSRNVLYAVIALLAVALLILGYSYYQERQNTAHMEINIGKSGISVETK